MPACTVGVCCRAVLDTARARGCLPQRVLPLHRLHPEPAVRRLRVVHTRECVKARGRALDPGALLPRARPRTFRVCARGLGGGGLGGGGRGGGGLGSGGQRPAPFAFFWSTRSLLLRAFSSFLAISRDLRSCLGVRTRETAAAAAWPSHAGPLPLPAGVVRAETVRESDHGSASSHSHSSLSPLLSPPASSVLASGPAADDGARFLRHMVKTLRLMLSKRVFILLAGRARVRACAVGVCARPRVGVHACCAFAECVPARGVCMRPPSVLLCTRARAARLPSACASGACV